MKAYLSNPTITIFITTLPYNAPLELAFVGGFMINTLKKIFFASRYFRKMHYS
jgi:hypothetical protein